MCSLRREHGQSEGYLIIDIRFNYRLVSLHPLSSYGYVLILAQWQHISPEHIMFHADIAV